MTDENGEAAPTREMSASAVIARFGGIRPMAKKLGVAVTTVQGWKERGAIPAARHGEVLQAAEREGIELSIEDLQAAGGAEPRAAPDPWTAAAAAAAEAEVAEGEKAAAGPTVAEPPAAEPPAAEAEAEEAPPPRSAPEPHRRRRAGRAVAAGLLIGVIVALAAAAGWWVWWADPDARPWQPLAQRPAVSADEVAALSGRVETLAGRIDPLAATVERIDSRLAALDQLQQRVAALEEGGAGGEVPPRVAEGLSEIDRLQERLSELEARDGAGGPPQEVVNRLDALDPRLAALESRLSALEEAPLGAGLDELRARVAALESAAAERPEAPADAPASGALLIAVGQLRDALRGSGSYAAELNAVRTLAPEEGRLDEALAPLAAHAEEGLPATATLRERFSEMAGRVVRAARLPEDAAWYDKALYQVTSLATVRRTGEVAGDTPEALVARAELRLAEGDLAGAVEVLERLEGRPAAAVEGWLADAKRRLAAERALATLQTVALADVRAAPEDGAPAPGPDEAPAAAPDAASPPASQEAPAVQ